jgi:hypothetical protein
MPRRVLLSDYTAKKRDELGVEIETPDGQVFVIDPPLFWPDDFQVIARSGDNPRIAAAVLGGEDRLAAFVAAGGSANVAVAIATEQVGATPGE